MEGNRMNMIKKNALQSLAAVLLLGSWSAFGAPGTETGTAAIAASGTSTPGEIVAAENDAPCAFGMCKEARFEQPRVETLIRSDVMPSFYSPALTPTVEAEAGC